MRLLKICPDGTFKLIKYLPREVPEYAILSHTWEPDDHEVTYQDFVAGAGRLTKTGYSKIQFCGQQAKSDGIEHFWIDSVCIDKSSSAELSESINSMYRWYQNAVKCYIYLTDVSSEGAWDRQFNRSRWFTRGWTLQELLAPSKAEFFSKQGRMLGDRRKLEAQIHEITGIPVLALQGTLLAEFSVQERLSWARKRVTTIEEDQAYCLLGLFGIYMPMIYGEGEESAFRRLNKEIATLDGMNQLLDGLSKGCNDSVAKVMFYESEKLGSGYEYFLGLAAPRPSDTSTWSRNRESIPTYVESNRIQATASSEISNPRHQKATRPNNLVNTEVFGKFAGYNLYSPRFLLHTPGADGQALAFDKIKRKSMLCIFDDYSETWAVKVESNHQTEPIFSRQYAFIAYCSDQFRYEERHLLQDPVILLAKSATQHTGLSAYWCARNCLSDEEVYSIAEITRSSHKFIIIVRPPSHDLGRSTEELLEEWLERSWSIPEFFMAPKNRSILVWREGSPPTEYSKREIARLSKDSVTLEKILDHYHGSNQLSRLELVLQIMKALAQTKTVEYLPGDLQYILMGFLRHKPKPVPTDSEFQAFVRVVLANDVDRLLERLLCIQPRSRLQPWHDVTDAWDLRLQEITPACRVFGLGDNDTVIIEDVAGTPLAPISTYSGIESAVAGGSGAQKDKNNTWKILRKWKDPKRSQISRFIIADGFPDARDESLQQIGLNPADFNIIDLRKGLGWQHFTLVDTQWKTKTVFYASQRPEAMILGGHEWGFTDRVLLCSYSPETTTFYREAVIRVNRLGEGVLSSVGTLQLSLAPRFVPQDAASVARDVNQEDHWTVPAAPLPPKRHGANGG